MRMSQSVRTLATLAVLMVASAGTAAAQVLYSNGPAVGPGNLSVIRPGGTLFGLGAQANLGNFVADDFSVGGGGWNVTGLSFFAYQTGANNQFTFTGVSWSIVSGDVNTGSVVASGSLAPANGGVQGYRVTSTTLQNQDRAIFQLDVDVADFSLGAGSFWLRWGVTGTLASGPWQPPTADGAIGNAYQSLANGPFNSFVDAGDQQGVELPFVIRGTPTTVVPEPSTWAMLLTGGLGMAALARRRRTS